MNKSTEKLKNSYKTRKTSKNSQSSGKTLLEPDISDRFYFANLVFQIKHDWILAASAMPEYEDQDAIIEPDPLPPNLWRAWVLAFGPGSFLSKTENIYYNPGVERHNFIYFKPEYGSFFYFNDISFVFVKMSNVEICLKT